MAGVERRPSTGSGARMVRSRTESLVMDERPLEKGQAPVVVGNLVDVKVKEQTFRGCLRFKGLADFAEGVWLGVALDSAMGKNDGTKNGKRYFDCEPSHGLFVREHMVFVVCDQEEESSTTPSKSDVEQSQMVLTPPVSGMPRLDQGKPNNKPTLPKGRKRHGAKAKSGGGESPGSPMTIQLSDVGDEDPQDEEESPLTSELTHERRPSLCQMCGVDWSSASFHGREKLQQVEAVPKLQLNEANFSEAVVTEDAWMSKYGEQLEQRVWGRLEHRMVHLVGQITDISEKHMLLAADEIRALLRGSSMLRPPPPFQASPQEERIAAKLPRSEKEAQPEDILQDAIDTTTTSTQPEDDLLHDEWVSIFQKHAGEAKDAALSQEDFLQALQEVHKPLTPTQSKKLWESFSQGTSRGFMDLRDFCKFANAVTTDNSLAAERADVSLDVWISMGVVEDSDSHRVTTVSQNSIKDISRSLVLDAEKNGCFDDAVNEIALKVAEEEEADGYVRFALGLALCGAKDCLAGAEEEMRFGPPPPPKVLPKAIEEEEDFRACAPVQPEEDEEEAAEQPEDLLQGMDQDVKDLLVRTKDTLTGALGDGRLLEAVRTSAEALAYAGKSPAPEQDVNSDLARRVEAVKTLQRQFRRTSKKQQDQKEEDLLYQELATKLFEALKSEGRVSRDRLGTKCMRVLSTLDGFHGNSASWDRSFAALCEKHRWPLEGPDLEDFCRYVGDSSGAGLTTAKIQEFLKPRRIKAATQALAVEGQVAMDEDGYYDIHSLEQQIKSGKLRFTAPKKTWVMHESKDYPLKEDVEELAIQLQSPEDVEEAKRFCESHGFSGFSVCRNMACIKKINHITQADLQPSGAQNQRFWLQCADQPEVNSA